MVTNWSLHSQSARDLVTDLFRKPTAVPKLSHAYALRRATPGRSDGSRFQDARVYYVLPFALPVFSPPLFVFWVLFFFALAAGLRARFSAGCTGSFR